MLILLLKLIRKYLIGGHEHNYGTWQKEGNMQQKVCLSCGYVRRESLVTDRYTW